MQDQKQEKLQYVEVLADKPKITKPIKEPSLSQKIILEFLTSKAQYGRINFEKLKGEYKSLTSAARALGRAARKKIKVYSDGKEWIYLEKKEAEKKK